MKRPKFFVYAAILMAASVFMSCSDDDDDDVTFNVTQANLDAVSTFIDDFTGGAMAHGGPAGTSSDSTVREVFSSLANLNGDFPLGTLVTKKTYKRGSDGNKTDQLYVSFAMVKRESGYNPTGGDWEYIKIANDPSVDYTAHKYGMLPDATDTENRGKLASCMGCHSSAGGGDYLYAND